MLDIVFNTTFYYIISSENWKEIFYVLFVSFGLFKTEDLDKLLVQLVKEKSIGGKDLGISTLFSAKIFLDKLMAFFWLTTIGIP